MPRPCASGTYNNFTGSDAEDDCAPCPPGSYCLGAGLPLPSGECFAGYFCNGSAAFPTQYEAPQGHFTLEGASSPGPCNPGTYNANQRQMNCTVCPERYYCDRTGVIEPSECPQGHFCPVGTALPERCPEGTFSAQLGLLNAEECTQCSPGYYCSSNGLVEPSGKCLPGFYCTLGSPFPNPNAIEFGGPCHRGHYCPEGSTESIPCPRGSYMPNQQAKSVSECMLCPEGRYCNDTALLEPTGDCKAGFYCSLGALTATPLDNSTGDICWEGHYCPTASGEPIKCPPGTFADVTGKEVCDTCPERFFCDGDDSTSYEICPAGHYCPDGTITPQKCNTGTYSNNTGLRSADECTSCTGGSFCSTRGLLEPTGLCHAGFSCPTRSMNQYGGGTGANHTICPQGSYCPQGTYQPVPCPLGTYSSSVQLESDSQCLSCENVSIKRFEIGYKLMCK